MSAIAWLVRDLCICSAIEEDEEAACKLRIASGGIRCQQISACPQLHGWFVFFCHCVSSSQLLSCVLQLLI